MLGEGLGGEGTVAVMAPTEHITRDDPLCRSPRFSTIGAR
jgi:hypothetical protein